MCYAATSDVADLDLSISAEPSLFPFGTTEVTFTVTDDSGNASMANTSLTVNDAALVVRTLDDELDSDPQNDLDDLSLREAIALANANPGIDQIRFAAGLTGSVMLQPSLGQLTITDSVTLSGLGTEDTVIDGQSAMRVLAIFGDQIDVDIDDLTIRNGFSNSNLVGGARGLF